MSKIRKFRRNKNKTIKNVNKIKSLFFRIALIMLNFIFATFAWFIFKMTLDVDVDVKVSAWKVDFKENDTSLETDVTFELENFYPGMQDFVKNIEIENLGDRAAAISYEITQLKILGTEYQIKETASAGDPANTLYIGQTVQSGKKVVKLLNDSTRFPFEITLKYSQEIATPSETDTNRNKGTFEIRLTWPYEATGTEEQKTQKNTLDTQWGYNIANFYEGLPAGDTTHGIEITLQAVAKQIID